MHGTNQGTKADRWQDRRGSKFDRPILRCAKLAGRALCGLGCLNSANELICARPDRAAEPPPPPLKNIKETTDQNASARCSVPMLKNVQAMRRTHLIDGAVPS